MSELIRHLLQRKTRTLLTVLAIAVGTFAVTAVGGIAENLQALVIQPALENARGRVSVWPKEWDRPLTEPFLRRLRRIEGMAGVTATISDRIQEIEGFHFHPLLFAGTRSDIPGLEYEPTGELDSATADEIMALLLSLNREGQTFIIVTHDPQVAAQTARTVHLHDGKIVQEERLAASPFPNIHQL